MSAQTAPPSNLGEKQLLLRGGKSAEEESTAARDSLCLRNARPLPERSAASGPVSDEKEPEMERVAGRRVASLEKAAEEEKATPKGKLGAKRAATLASLAWPAVQWRPRRHPRQSAAFLLAG